jgi:hypothetical protein
VREKVSVTDPRRRGISKDTIPWVEEHGPVKQWMKEIEQNRVPWRYASALKNLMQGLDKSPEQLLADLEANAKQNSITIKAHIGSLKSRAAVRSQLSALHSFLAFRRSYPRLGAGRRTQGGGRLELDGTNLLSLVERLHVTNQFL